MSETHTDIYSIPSTTALLCQPGQFLCLWGRKKKKKKKSLDLLLKFDLKSQLVSFWENMKDVDDFPIAVTTVPPKQAEHSTHTQNPPNREATTRGTVSDVKSQNISDYLSSWLNQSNQSAITRRSWGEKRELFPSLRSPFIPRALVQSFLLISVINGLMNLVSILFFFSYQFKWKTFKIVPEANWNVVWIVSKLLAGQIWRNHSRAAKQTLVLLLDYNFIFSTWRWVLRVCARH